MVFIFTLVFCNLSNESIKICEEFFDFIFRGLKSFFDKFQLYDTAVSSIEQRMILFYLQTINKFEKRIVEMEAYPELLKVYFLVIISKAVRTSSLNFTVLVSDAVFK